MIKLKDLLTEQKFYVAIYSKAKTKKDLKDLVKKRPKDPWVDMSHTGKGPYGTPEEIRKYFRQDHITVVGPRSKYYAELIYKNGKWTVR